jgi:hypothetical protein
MIDAVTKTEKPATRMATLALTPCGGPTETDFARVVRGDMKLENLLDRTGADSLSEPLRRAERR